MKTPSFTFRPSDSDKEWLNQLATEHGVSRAWILNRCIEVIRSDYADDLPDRPAKHLKKSA